MPFNKNGIDTEQQTCLNCTCAKVRNCTFTCRWPSKALVFKIKLTTISWLEKVHSCPANKFLASAKTGYTLRDNGSKWPIHRCEIYCQFLVMKYS